MIGLKLGRELVVVAFTYPIVKEIHTRDEFDGRPDNFFLRLRTMGTRSVIYDFISLHVNFNFCLMFYLEMQILNLFCFLKILDLESHGMSTVNTENLQNI